MSSELQSILSSSYIGLGQGFPDDILGSMPSFLKINIKVVVINTRLNMVNSFNHSGSKRHAISCTSGLL